MKKLFAYCIITSSLFFLGVSCESEVIIEAEFSESKTVKSNANMNYEELLFSKNRMLLMEHVFTQTEIEDLKSAGMLGLIKKYEVTDKDNRIPYFEYEIDGDAYISEKDLKRIIKDNKRKQYRTNSIVWPHQNRVINIRAINMGNFPNIRNGLIEAVNNYNELNAQNWLNLSFTLQFANNIVNNGSTINIVIQQSTEFGGFADFPSGGNPYNLVILYSSNNNLPIDMNEHIATHEIGHCLGMRHTDYSNRSVSCGVGGNEGFAGVGAVWIIGTTQLPNGDINSVFMSCFNAQSNGEFTDGDRYALRYTYCPSNAFLCNLPCC